MTDTYTDVACATLGPCRSRWSRDTGPALPLGLTFVHVDVSLFEMLRLYSTWYVLYRLSYKVVCRLGGSFASHAILDSHMLSTHVDGPGSIAVRVGLSQSQTFAVFVIYEVNCNSEC